MHRNASSPGQLQRRLARQDPGDATRSVRLPVEKNEQIDPVPAIAQARGHVYRIDDVAAEYRVVQTDEDAQVLSLGRRGRHGRPSGLVTRGSSRLARAGP